MQTLNTIFIETNARSWRSWTGAGIHFCNVRRLLLKLKAINIAYSMW